VIAGLPLAMAAGALLMLGCVLLVARLLPAQVDLAEALGRLTPSRHADLIATTESTTGKERLGVWAIRVLPPGIWVRTPTRELALLRIPLAKFYGDKLTFAALGLVAPPLLGKFFEVLGIGLPIMVPAFASVALAAVCFFIPNYNAIDDAKRARVEFAR